MASSPVFVMVSVHVAATCTFVAVAVHVATTMASTPDTASISVDSEQLTQPVTTKLTIGRVDAGSEAQRYDQKGGERPHHSQKSRGA
jgi:hypothetical protein